MTDPPNDELVNAETQLNANFQDLEDKLVGFNQSPGVITSPPTGIEAFFPTVDGDNSHQRIAVYDGTTWRLSRNMTSTWGPWQSMTAVLDPIRSERTVAPLVFKVNTYMRRVVMSGGLHFNVAQAAWPLSRTAVFATGSGIIPTYAPAGGGLAYFQAATSQVTGANQVATAVIEVVYESAPVARVAIYITFQGDAGGGNFVQFDNVEWWY